MGMGSAIFATGAGLLLLTLGIVRIFQVGVEYGDRRRLQQFKAHALVADELLAARTRRKDGNHA